MMTTVMTLGLILAVIVLLAGFGVELGTPNPTAGGKFLEWLSTVLVLIAGFLFGAILIPPHWHDWIHGQQPRGVNVAGVKFKEDTITFPPPTEIGARWVMIPITTGTASTPVFITHDEMSVPAGASTVQVYMTFPDGRRTPAVEIGKDGSVVATSAGS